MRIKALYFRLSTLLVLAVVSDSLHASVRLTTLYTFRKIGQPTGRLLQDKEGNFYGTASGFYDDQTYMLRPGAVFKISPQGEVVWQLQLTEKDGALPLPGLFQDEQGFLYGTASFGGIENFWVYSLGTVFKVSPDGELVWSRPFHGVADGEHPIGELVQGCDGSLFGTTHSGGTHGYGTIFRLTAAGAIKAIYSFNGYDGAGPSGGLVRGVDGYFYGTTQAGGGLFSYPFGTGDGTLFRMSCEGALTTLHKFTNPATNIDTESEIQGTVPTGQLIRRNDGCFYGVTEGRLTRAGTNFWGSVFKIDPNGTLSTLLYFDTSQSDAANPVGPLVTGYDGSLYGVTTQGGASVDDGAAGYGTVFKIAPAGTFLNIVSFRGTNGCNPFSGLIRGKDGSLYGTTHGNNIYGTDFGNDIFPGTLFKLSISRPVLSIAHRQQLVHPTNAEVTVTGQTKSRANVLDVFYQLNGGDWTEATTTNEWKNWSATVTLSPGKNILRAYAIDSTGDLSRTNSVKLLFDQP
jgi:uncharacterized repeat protein (TIGR03803 family)